MPRKQSQPKVQEYVDTRNIWPRYVRGLVAIELPGKKRGISVADARVVAGYDKE